MDINDARNKLPRIGAIFAKKITCDPYESYHDIGTVVYVNKEHLYYVLDFGDGIRQAYKVV